MLDFWNFIILFTVIYYAGAAVAMLAILDMFYNKRKAIQSYVAWFSWLAVMYIWYNFYRDDEA